jgi:hypothetical protein
MDVFADVQNAVQRDIDFAKSAIVGHFERDLVHIFAVSSVASCTKTALLSCVGPSTIEHANETAAGPVLSQNGTMEQSATQL